MMNSEKGQVLPLALLALALGSVVITPFIGYASSSLIGSRIYEEVMTEQYSADAGVEWALWKLKGNPLLTTNTAYHADSLEPIPSEINGPSFPTTEIRFVEDSEDSEETTLEWRSDPGWKYVYELEMEGPGTVTLEFETAAEHVKVWLGQTVVYNELGPPYEELVLQINSEGTYIIQVQTPSDGVLVIMVVTTTYPAAIYDIRAQQDNSIITVRAKASYLGIGVISWQVE